MMILTMDEKRDSNNDNDVSVSMVDYQSFEISLSLIDDVSKYVAMLCLYTIRNHFLAVSLYHQVTKLRYMGKQWL